MTEKRKINLDQFKIDTNKNSSIKHVIPVTSGKGGVGKSLVTSILASKLAKDGYKVGILDADITGPSIPQTFGLEDSVVANKEGIIPEETGLGIKVISVNLILQNKTDPVVWRASIVNNVLKQFYSEVNWGDLDFLLVDMPPGTSDIPLTIFQSLPIDGAVVVTSPQDLVGMVVEKSINMARMMGIQILGLVENMSYFKCPDCGKISYIFGKSRVDDLAEKYGVKTCAKLPINPDFAALVDQGKVEEIDLPEIEDLAKKIESL